jgi:hypothetical protein
MSFPVPVALMVFNRPVQTAIMFEAIRKLRPQTLMVIADGPRADHATDAERCAEVRRIVSAVDWPCEARINFADANMGLKERVVSGLNWVFDQTEQAIIVEDDCLPDPSFFAFCQELLARYADDQRVMSISGNNFQFGATQFPHSYYFSRHFHCWGWASWRRAWRLHDPAMPFWPELKQDGWLESFILDQGELRHWHNNLDNVYTGKVNTWDVQFNYSVLRHNGLNINPAVNLVSNIGFGADATHTIHTSPFDNVPSTPMPFPLAHPPHMVRNFFADDNYARTAFRVARQYIW